MHPRCRARDRAPGDEPLQRRSDEQDAVGLGLIQLGGDQLGFLLSPDRGYAAAPLECDESCRPTLPSRIRLDNESGLDMADRLRPSRGSDSAVRTCRATADVMPAFDDHDTYVMHRESSCDRAAYHPCANDKNIGINGCTPAHTVTLHGLSAALEVRGAHPDLDFSCLPRIADSHSVRERGADLERAPAILGTRSRATWGGAAPPSAGS